MSLSRTQVDYSWLSAVITNTQESNIHTTLFTLCVSLKQQAKKVWWSKKGVTFCKKKLCPHFFQFHMVLLLPLSSTYFHFYLHNKHCIYVLTWCCLLHIYTPFEESHFSLNMKGNILPSVYTQSSWQVWANAPPKTPELVTRKRQVVGKKV